MLIFLPFQISQILLDCWGGNIKPTKVDLKTTRPIIISIAKFIDFIDKDPSE